MDEEILRDFFIGIVPVQALAWSLAGAVETKTGVSRYHVADMSDCFEVKPEHLVKICDAFIDGHLTAAHLQIIGFSLIASDAFEWDGLELDGERITAVANDWTSPEINYPITLENVKRWRSYLLGDDDDFGAL